MSDTRCPTCGAGPKVWRQEGPVNRLVAGCKCPSQPEPTMADLIAELRACRSEIRAIRDNTERLTARATGFAELQIGEAVLPGADPFKPS